MLFYTSASGDSPTERMRINNAGNVGIGTSAPAARLVIDDATTTQNGVSIVKASSMGFSALSVTHQTSVDTRTIADFNNIAGTVMLIRGDGNVGIGTSSPASKMQISGSGNQELLITNTDAGSLSLRHAVTIATLGTVDNIPLKFETNSAERLRITSTGDVGIGTSSPAVKLDIVGRARASTGILFGTDTADANALDDYEEGTYTATLTCDTGTITLNSGSGGDLLRYTKIGRVVTVSGRLTVDSVSSPTGFIQINLPFEVESAVNGMYTGPIACESPVSLDSGQFTIQARSVGGASTARIFITSESTISSGNQNAEQVQTDTAFFLALTYFEA